MTDEEIPLLKKSLLVGYAWWLLLGPLGAHRFYLRDYLFGALYFVTLGFAGIGWLIDLFLLPGKVRDWNDQVDDAWFDSREALEDRIDELEDQVDDLMDELESK